MTAARRLVALVALIGVLAACDPAPAQEPTATFEWPTLPPTVPPSPTVAPVLPEGDGEGGMVIGASNPTQAALAAEGQPSQEPETATPAPTESMLPMTISAPDGTPLLARYYAPSRRPAPAVLLIHQAGGSQQDWDPLVEPLRAAGYAVMTFDLRGHGGSGGQADWGQMLTDAHAALSLLSEIPSVDPSQIAIVGASVGANIALNACAVLAGCAAAELLSPGLAYHGIATAGAMPRLGRRPLLIAASEADGNNPADSVMLDSLATSSDHQLIVFSAAGHGTQMFAAQPDLIARIVEWLVARVPPAGAAVTPAPAAQ